MVNSLVSLIIFDCAAVVGLIMSSFVIATISRKGIRSISSKILVYFHVTLFLDILTFFPHIYNYPPGVCQFMAWLHYYSELANAIVTFLMITYYRHLLLQESWTLFPFAKPWRMEKWIGISSLVTLLPFSTNAYGNVDHTWCDMEIDTEEAKLWSLFAFYLWEIVSLSVAVLIFLQAWYRVYKVDTQLAFNAISTIGLYCLMAVVTVPLRMVFRIAFGNYSLLLISISAWVYFLIFLREKKALALFEALNQGTNADLEGADEFSWTLDEQRADTSFSASFASHNTNTANIAPVSFRPSSFGDNSGEPRRSSALVLSVQSNPVLNSCNENL